jgi:hypothetical protein
MHSSRPASPGCDQVFPNGCGYLPGQPIVPLEQMPALVKAALDARHDSDMLIVAHRRCRPSRSPQNDASERCKIATAAENRRRASSLAARRSDAPVKSN